MDKIRQSLFVQIGFLFFVSSCIIIILWISFYIQQKHQNQEHNIARYFSIVSSIQPILFQSLPISDEDVSAFNMRVSHESLLEKTEIILEKGDKNKGFSVIKYQNKTIIHVYNAISEVYLEDLQNQDNYLAIHIVFTLLFMIQILLYMRLKKTLNPLSKLQKKLKELEKGDLSSLDIQSSYDEIKQIITSYNNAISKIEYLLEMREMFNKIFMHEMKMPIAKGMFYLKQEPSEKTHHKINQIFNRLNTELDEFSTIESLIVYKDSIEPIAHKFLDILNIAIEKVGIENKDNISTIGCEDCTVYGDKNLWILCFKNIIDNAIKYATDKKLKIVCQDNTMIFQNQGEELPVDISQNIKKWKIEKNKRHKSSTGYGFGLFIIKNIVLLNGYKLGYSYANNSIELKLEKSFVS